MATIRNDDANDDTSFTTSNTSVTAVIAKYPSTFPQLLPEEHTVTPTAATAFTASTKSTATVLTATGATSAQVGCQCSKFHLNCLSTSRASVGVIPTPPYCQKAPGFSSYCGCHSVGVPDHVTPRPYYADGFEVKKSMAVSADTRSGNLMYLVPYLVKEDRKFWFHPPNGDCMYITVKEIAEKQCAGHWANTCSGQPYYQCVPKDKIRYDAKDFNAVFQMSGLSHIEFHKRYRPF
ncbi:hypothetical protein BDV26DRAFT_256622 [Aspergillus bertholletiae]|uniref:Uncharacterized protein n=1 Tax=Aspergillus bertholletiae TaxID=1226010 RepID=A0A5N7BGA9_9EURO|nr:hypothetical protein BDV26DRAFT_256622 [Aspergillus bertholletiae]